MKRKVIIALVVIVAAFLCVNFFVSRNAKAGLRTAIEQFDASAPEAFRYIGAATQFELSRFHGADYSITVVPFDWVEQSLSVSHTAFIKAEDRELRIRLRLSPLGAPNDIVGYTRKK